MPKTGAAFVGVSLFIAAKFAEVLEEREMGCLELALRDVEEKFRCPETDEEDAETEGRRKREKRRKMYIPRAG